MRIAGRLSDTTLGDVLATLARAGVTGLVRLTESAGPTAGRTHGIYLSKGSVVGVESQVITMPLGEILRQRGLLDDVADRQLTLRLASGTQRTGEILVEERLMAREVVGAALRHQIRTRLEALFRLRDAAISFHVACPAPRGVVVQLPANEYLGGKPRARDASPRARDPGPRAYGGGGTRETEAKAVIRSRGDALRALGLSDGASLADVSRAFRALARGAHPDRLAGASDAEKRDAEHRFAKLSAAYHALLESA